MSIEETELEGCFIVKPDIYNDGRGYFFETFNQKEFNKKLGVNIQFIQDNESLSSKGVLRGLHYQKGKYAQAKLVRAIKGSVQDVVVDLRKNSKSFGKYFSIILSEENKKQLFIPRGFAHGFLVLEDRSIFSYKCDNFYNKTSEAGIIYNDPDLNINWVLSEEKIILSEKDKNQQEFKSAVL